MHCQEDNIRELITSAYGASTLAALMAEVDHGRAVIFHFKDGSERCAYKGSEIEAILRDHFGWVSGTGLTAGSITAGSLSVGSVRAGSLKAGSAGILPAAGTPPSQPTGTPTPGSGAV